MTGSGDKASEPASCALGYQCNGPHTPGLQGQVRNCTKAGVTDRRDLVTGLVDCSRQTSKPWGKACLSHGAQPTSLATRYLLFVIPTSVQQLVWPMM